ncbi:MAG: acylneuraminate cytidylyltransferase family protein [Alphaproteobacteria bacterium]
MKNSNASILCLINARGGSKGVPGKNLKPLAGKPLIAWSIDTAKQSKLIKKTVVSTDSEDIARVATQHGAYAPFLRPADLATDTAKQVDVIIHALKFLESMGERYDYVCILQPTCPLRSVADVDGALGLLTSSRADSVITVTDVGGRHPRTLYKLHEGDNKLTPYVESSKRGVIRQDFETLYWRTGAVYAMKRDVIMKGSLYGEDTRGYKVPEERAFNIDTPFDFELTEAWLKSKAQ